MLQSIILAIIMLVFIMQASQPVNFNSS